MNSRRGQLRRALCLSALLATAASFVATGAVALAKRTSHKPWKHAVYSNCSSAKGKKKRQKPCIPKAGFGTNSSGTRLEVYDYTKCSPRIGANAKGRDIKIKKNGRFKGTERYYTVAGNQLTNTVVYTITIRGRFSTVFKRLKHHKKKRLFIAKGKIRVKSASGCHTASKKFKFFRSRSFG